MDVSIEGIRTLSDEKLDLTLAELLGRVRKLLGVVVGIASADQVGSSVGLDHPSTNHRQAPPAHPLRQTAASLSGLSDEKPLQWGSQKGSRPAE